MALISLVYSTELIQPRLSSDVLTRIRQVELNGCPGLTAKLFEKYREESKRIVEELKLSFELERWSEAARLALELENLSRTIGAESFMRACHHFRLKFQNGLSGYNLKLEREPLLFAYGSSLEAVNQAEQYLSEHGKAA